MSGDPSQYIRAREETFESSSASFEDSHEEQMVPYKGKYSAERLMMMLDKERLEALEEEFNEHPDGIELHNFIWLMKCAMTVSPEEKADLVLGLYYLFQEIDINGDEHMEWSEFTQYIIDAVMGQQNKERSEDKDLTPAEIMELAHSHKSRRYQLSKLIDRNFHGGYLRHVVYHNALDLVSVIEMGRDTVKFFNTMSEIKFSITPKYKNSGFVLSMAYSEKEYMLVISASDKCFYIYEKENNSFRASNIFQTEYVNMIIWYFELHNIWITACDDHSIRCWDMRKCEEIWCYQKHQQAILDAIEIKNPFCIATASLDSNIFLWDLSEHRNIGTLTGKHFRGVRSIDYNSEYGGNIVSVGYERDIHVWSPEVTLSKCYTGKLEGHNCPVVACKFFKGRPICVSVDEKCNTRVWDIRQLTCLQIITHDKGKIEVSKLVTMTKHDKFIIAGRRLIWYELMKDSLLKNNYKDVNPIYADFNTYYLQFIVVTKFDIRIYDCVNGKLRKIYTDVQNPRTESELSAMVLDHRNRICIVGDNSGSIRAYNFANGALMKSINNDIRENMLASDEEKEIEEPKKKTSDWNSEISAFYFCDQDKLLVAASWDSSIMIYDMKDIEEVNLLRVMKGGHQGSDITCITYSPYLSFIASGSSNGIVSIWDFEIGKLEGSVFGHKREISSISFLEPYPIMITFSLDDGICLWNVRSNTGKQRFKCIARFKNISWAGSADEKTSVSVSANIIMNSVGIARYKRRKYTRQKMNDNKQFDKTLNFFKTREGEKIVDSDEESIYDWVQDQNAEIIEDPSIKEVRERCYLYIGDTKGYIKIWSFDTFLAKKKISMLDKKARDKASYNPRRKDIKNAESDVKYWKKESENEELPNVIDAENDILVREWKAHEDSINCLRAIHEPKSILSCSLDRYIKVWSREGEVWGIINLCSPEVPKKWFFPFDWEGKRQADIKKVVEVLSLIEEKVDINPNLIPAGPTKKKKKQRTVKKPTNSIIPKKPQIPPTAAYDWEDYYEDDYEEPGEKLSHIRRKEEGNVLDLQRKLDEFDEKRKAEWDDPNIKEVNKKVQKGRNRYENDTKKTELNKAQSNPKLPKIHSNRPNLKLSSEKNEPQTSRVLQKSSSKYQLSDFPEPIHKVQSLKRPIIGLGSTGITNNFGIQKKLSNPKLRKEMNCDVRFIPGESARMLNRAISSQNFLHSSVLSPYTEDLKTLQKKNEIVKELSSTRNLNGKTNK